MPTPYYTKIETDSIISNLPNGGGGSSTPETTTSLGQLINSSGNATITDSDLVATAVSGGVLKKASHIVIKMFYKIYYDTIYQPLLSSGINIKTLNGQSILGFGDIVIIGGGGGGATNLTKTQSPTNTVIISDTGTDAIIELGDGTNAGVSINNYSSVEKTKLSNIQSSATANSSDATLLNRSNHTGTQTASTISDIQSTITNNTAVITNTAKISFDSTSSNRLSNTSGTNTGDNATNTQYSGLESSKQNILLGTGFVKSTAGTISYDTNTYLTTVPAQSFASITGKPTTLSGYGITDAVQPNLNAVFSSVNSNVIISLTYTANVLNWTGLESNLLKIVLTKDSVLANPSTPITNSIYQFIVEQNNIGLWTLTYGNKFKFPNGTVPVIDLNANSKGLLTAMYDGTHFLVVSAQNFL